MKYVKFIMSKGLDITVDEPQAREILKSPQQSHPVKDPKTGEWTLETINKAFMIGTKRDVERERAEAEKAARETIKIAAPEITEEQAAKNRKRLDNMRKELIEKKVLPKRK